MLLKPTLDTSPQPQTRFCKDCKYCINTNPVGRGVVQTLQPQEWKCAHSRHVSFMDGIVTYNYCESERAGFTTHYCGPDAQFYEAV